jgi:hypothetical protein
MPVALTNVGLGCKADITVHGHAGVYTDFRRDRRANILQIAALAPKPFSASAAYLIGEVSYRVQPRVEVFFCLILRDPITLLYYSL